VGWTGNTNYFGYVVAFMHFVMRRRFQRKRKRRPPPVALGKISDWLVIFSDRALKMPSHFNSLPFPTAPPSSPVPGVGLGTRQ
jgi:hypothetical protein